MTATPGPQQPDEVEARDQYGHTEADHDAAGVCRRPSMKAREAVAPYAVLGKDWQRAWMVGWDAARAELFGQLGQPCGSCGGRGGVHTRRCPAAPSAQPDETLCPCWHGTMSGRCFEHDVQARSTDPGGDGYSCACPRPAAPSAQPDEVRLGCDVCGKPSTWTSTPGGIRFCDDHGSRR